VPEGSSRARALDPETAGAATHTDQGQSGFGSMADKLRGALDTRRK
jgi:hypothetical protein